MMSKFNKGLLKGSVILLISFGLFNFFHFLFQFFMARFLSISEYGVLASLFAIFYIFQIFTESVQTVITKYSANESNKGKLKNLIKRASKKSLRFSFFLFLFYLVISIPLPILLKINYLLLSFNGLIIFLTFFLPLNRGIMQGRERFNSLGVNMILEAICKLVLGVFFVYIGWKVYGALLGVILGGIVAFLFSFIQLKDIIKSKEEKAKTPGIYNYAKPAFFINSIIIIFYSLDVIIARIFFSPEVAGSYAIASILGKIIFWGTLPISKAMFPMTADVDKNRGKGVFSSSITILFLGIIFALVLFYFAPGFIVNVFSGKFIPEASKILFYSGLSFGFVSLSNLILLHKLSTNKVKRYPLLAIFIILEIILLSYFSKDLVQFSVAFIVSSVSFLWGSIFLLNE